MAPIFSKRSRQDWIDRLRAIRVPAGPILRPDEAIRHPQALAAGMLLTLQHPTVGAYETVASPYHLDRTPVSEYASPPLLGADTDALLAEELGMSPEAIRALRDGGAVG